LQVDLTRAGAFGFSMGGFSALALGGAQVSLPRLTDYCTTMPDQPDCQWYLGGGIDSAQLDDSLISQSMRDPRIRAIFALDPALPRVVTPDSLSAMTIPVMIANLGSPGQIPAGMDWTDSAPLIPGPTLVNVSGATHFSPMMPCRLIGRIIIGLAGEDSICADTAERDRATVRAEIEPQVVAFFQNALVTP
jgi:predicted dienelactone hydrolase